jgi:hypothetical protein
MVTGNTPHVVGKSIGANTLEATKTGQVGDWRGPGAICLAQAEFPFQTLKWRT